jgi:hypothetical protein
MMIRRKRILLIAVAAVPIGALAACFIFLLMAASGAWPFEPLQRRVRNLELQNGALIRIEGVEDRGWQSDGFLWSASFRQLGGKDFVQFGSWIGPNDNLRAYISGALIVCPNPNLRMLHVRGRDGEWRVFDLRLPGKTENLSDFSRFTPTLNEDDLRRIQTDLTDAEASYSPSIYIQAFDPETRQLRTKILAVLTREAVFELSEDGRSVSLKSLQRIR